MYYSPRTRPAAARLRQVLEIPVTDFELSVRSRNCLKKMNIRTLGDLTRVSEQQLLSSKNFGETSLDEIKEMMGPRACVSASRWKRARSTRCAIGRRQPCRRRSRRC